MSGSIVTLVTVLVGTKQLLYFLGVEYAMHGISLIVKDPLKIIVVLSTPHSVVQILLEG